MPIDKETAKGMKKSDEIYSLFKERLEKDYMGKIVAIDMKAEKIAGIGSSLTEAYQKAIENSDQKQFTFKRVGSNYLYRLPILFSR
ncbi:MAG: hypothetical protein V1678_01650 [Candidatus Aenigmatarchaeota archaeon]